MNIMTTLKYNKLTSLEFLAFLSNGLPFEIWKK